MQRAFGLSIPQTLDDVCDPARLALAVCPSGTLVVGTVLQAQWPEGVSFARAATC
jgi:hypothetical protein